MKKFILTLMMVLLPLLLSTTAMAGGAGPSKDLKKGIILSADPAAHTMLFKDDKTGETITLRVPENLEVRDDMMNRKVLVNLVHQDHGAAEPAAGHEPAELREVKSIEIMFLTMTVGRIIALMAIGAIGGLLSGFIGSGGAFVMTPAMMSLGAPGAVAVASNMCHKFPKAMVGAYKRWKYGQADIKLGLVMAVSAIVGVQIGIQIQKFILAAFGGAGSNLYISVVFLIVLVFVGGYVFFDAIKLMKNTDQESGQAGALAMKMQALKIPPMITFKTANITISAWVTLPVGILTGMLAATIAVGGFIGVPGLIYVMGVSAVAASATELVIAFVMGCWGSIQWGLAGLIDIRLTVLLLSCSLIGVQLGALGTTYVKDYVIKLVMAATMLIVAVSRGAKVPAYLVDLGWMQPLADSTLALLNQVSFWSLITALGTAGLIIIVAMIKGMAAARA